MMITSVQTALSSEALSILVHHLLYSSNVMWPSSQLVVLSKCSYGQMLELAKDPDHLKDENHQSILVDPDDGPVACLKGEDDQMSRRSPFSCNVLGILYVHNEGNDPTCLAGCAGIDSTATEP